MIDLKSRKFAVKEHKILKDLDVSHESYTEPFFLNALIKNKKHPFSYDATIKKEIVNLSVGSEGFISNIFNNVANKFKTFINFFSDKKLTIDPSGFDAQTHELLVNAPLLIKVYNDTPTTTLNNTSVQIMSGLQVDIKTGVNILLGIYQKRNIEYYIKMINDIDTVVCKLMSDEDYRLQLRDIKLNNEADIKNLNKDLFDVTNKLINPKSSLDYTSLTQVIRNKEDISYLLSAKGIFLLGSKFDTNHIKRLNEVTEQLGNNVDSLLEVVNNHDVDISKEHMTKLFVYLDAASSMVSYIGMHYKIYRSFISTLLNTYAQLVKG